MCKHCQATSHLSKTCPIVVAGRNQLILRLHLQGCTQKQIGDKVGLSQASISEILRKQSGMTVWHEQKQSKQRVARGRQRMKHKGERTKGREREPEESEEFTDLGIWFVEDTDD
jgi:predicted transcriptional regulator